MTYDYLISNGFCDSDKILHIFGGIVPSAYKPDVPIKVASNRERPLQICFVAQRYSLLGAEKGYDVFARVVSILANDDRFNFHVVGGFDRDTIDLHEASNVTFYGVRPADFFQNFYSEMDIILSPNISMAELDPSYPRTFDGFPTTAVVEAGLCGVAMLISDFENMNRSVDGVEIFSENEICIIDRDVDNIVEIITNFEGDRVKLLALREAGKRSLRREFSFEKQMQPRIDLMRRYMN